MKLPVELMLTAAFSAGAYALATRLAMRDIKGLSKKMNRVVAVLSMWADTPEKKQQVADLIAPR